jgi:hypothetical protein
MILLSLGWSDWRTKFVARSRAQPPHRLFFSAKSAQAVRTRSLFIIKRQPGNLDCFVASMLIR